MRYHDPAGFYDAAKLLNCHLDTQVMKHAMQHGNIKEVASIRRLFGRHGSKMDPRVTGSLRPLTGDLDSLRRNVESVHICTQLRQAARIVAKPATRNDSARSLEIEREQSIVHPPVRVPPFAPP